MANDFFSGNLGSSSRSPSSQNKLLKLLAYLLLCTAILLISAGRIDWPMAWIYLGLYLTILLIMVLVLRYQKRSEIPGWGKSLAGGLDLVWSNIYNLSNPITLFVAGFDIGRLGLSPPISLWVRFIMLAILIAAFGLVTWAMGNNIFYSNNDITQIDPGQYVISTGPYGFLRHPGNAGMIILSLALPVSFGSLWALIPGGFMVLTFVIRTALEDRILQEDLDGYRDYSHRVRYRLIPGIW